MMDADERALLAAIIANPDEDTPRLIYADWLQEHDQPERAEYITLGIQLANLRYGEPKFEAREEKLRERIGALTSKCYDAWAAELMSRLPANRDIGFHFERGFVHRVWCSPKYYLDNADALFRELPLREVMPSALTAATAKRLVNSTHFRRLQAISLSKPAKALALLTCPSVEIDRLDCSQFLYFSSGEWDGVATAVAGHAGLKSVKVIDFERCGICDPGGQALADAPHLNPERLNLLTNELSAPVKRALRNRYGTRVWIDEPDHNGFPRRTF